MARFMEIQSVNPKMKQKEIAREIGCSSSTPQRYRTDQTCKVPTNHTTPKDLEMTSKDLNKPQKSQMKLIRLTS